MRRKKSLPIIVLCVIIALSLPVAFTAKLRSQVATFFSGFFHEQAQVKLSSDEVLRRQIERLKNQNALLKEKLVRVTQELKTCRLFEQEEQRLGKLDVQRRREELIRLITLQHDGVHAKIVYRPVTSWNSGFWVDAGEETNKRLGYTAIGKNSPVLYDGYLIGIVEQVTDKQARIRLITDPDLSVAVRANREGQPLAKGEIHGSDMACYSRGSTLLKGQGFNYDFADREGPAIDLRSRDPYIIKVGDTLITTGLDGLFPAGIPVATVKDVAPLKEGDYAYSLIADPLSTCDNLHTVFILPPLSS